jgi:hypothetical protein
VAASPGRHPAGGADGTATLTINPKVLLEPGTSTVPTAPPRTGVPINLTFPS